MPRLPRWRRISDDLLRRLQEGEFAGGFPGELALAERYEVSRGTIRRALTPLREQGIVHAGRGRRPYVIDTRTGAGLGPMYSLRDAITAGGSSEDSEVLQQRPVTSTEVATALGLAPETPFVHVARVRRADGAPFAVDRLWIVASVGEPLLEADLSHTSVYEVLRSRCDVEFDSGVEHTRAMAADADVATRLQVAEGSPLLTIRRTSCLAGRPAELRETCAIGDRVTLTHAFGDAPPGEGPHVTIPWD